MTNEFEHINATVATKATVGHSHSDSAVVTFLGHTFRTVLYRAVLHVLCDNPDSTL